MNGFLLIDKPKGYTSFDVCAKIRKKFNIKKVGHTGTLDPFATGLLVVAVGKGTRCIPFLEKLSKTYETKILLGKISETHDTESSVKNILVNQKIYKKEIQSILEKNFQGKIKQRPPKFSAIKIDGKRAYDLARKEKNFEIPKRETEIFYTKILDYDFPYLNLELKVQAGFYVRSLARDLGKILGTGAICEELRRTFVGDINISQAEKIDDVKNLLDPKILLTNFRQVEIEPERIVDFSVGRAFPFLGKNKEKILFLHKEKTIGIGEVFGKNVQPKVVF